MDGGTDEVWEVHKVKRNAYVVVDKSISELYCDMR